MGSVHVIVGMGRPSEGQRRVALEFKRAVRGEREGGREMVGPTGGRNKEVGGGVYILSSFTNHGLSQMLLC